MSDAVWDERAPGPRQPPPAPPVSPLPGAAIRVTDESDGEIINSDYSYWANAWVSPTGLIYAFIGHADGHPRFFRIATDGTVDRLGTLLPHIGTSEGWYWDREGWIYLLEGPRLRRVNPFSGQDLVVLDISNTHLGCDLWQAHSSDDGLVHSATVRRIVNDGAYPKIGTVVLFHGHLEFFGALGDLDESQVTSDGAFLIIQESNDNRVIDLRSKEEQRILDSARAVAHMDVGDSFIVGEADKPDPGACVFWDLTRPLVPENCRVLFPTLNLGHVAVRNRRCLLSDETNISLVDLDTGARTQIVSHGMSGSGYDFQVQANLSPDGSVAAWVSNLHGRMDLFITRINTSSLQDSESA